LRNFSFHLALIAVTSALVISSTSANVGFPKNQTSSPNSDTQIEKTDYHLQINDVLEISVIGEPEISKTVTVLQDGTITYPYIGTFKVVSLPIDEVNRRITAKLKSQFINPTVNVALTKSQESFVSVLGAVKNPGKVILKEGWRVLDLLAVSGGITSQRAAWVTATLVRNGGMEAIPLDMSRLLTKASRQDNLIVGPGDILLVSERDESQKQVQVLGEVVRQGAYPMPSDGSIISLIAQSGGVTSEAALSRAVIRRGSVDIPIDLRSLLQKDYVPAATTSDEKSRERISNEISNEASLRLTPGDTLFIPQNLQRFAVLGAVTRPGPFPYPEDHAVDVMEAVSRAGGQSQDADLRNVYLLRSTPDQSSPSVVTPKPVKLDLSADALRSTTSKQSGKDKKQHPSPLKITIKPGDVIVVSSKNPNRASWRDFLPLVPVLIYTSRR